MVILIFRLMGLGMIIAAIVLWIDGILRMPLMPESWDEEKGEYIPCADCCWKCDDDYSLFGEPGPGCRDCPFCHKPGDHTVE